MNTDSGSDPIIMFGRDLVTDGAWTVVVTDSLGNTVQKPAVITGWVKPTPTPEK